MAITIAVNKISNNISISTDDVVISTAEVVQPITVNTAVPSVVFDASYLAVTPSGLVTATNVQGAIDQLAAVTEANDLTTSVTWADVPDANITESSVVQYITSANVSAAGAAMLTGADFTGDVTITNGELTVNGSAEAELFKGDIEGAIHFKGAVASGATLTKGDVVYISGYSGQKTEVDLADASDSNKMPAFGIVAADPVGVNVDIVTFGTLQSINTSSYTDGDELYVSTTAGGLTATTPSGEGNLVQKIAKVVKAHTSGNIKVMGAGRTNATPNLNNGNIFIGDSNNLATTASFATQVASAETSHADVVVDGDFTSAGIMTTDGSGGYSVDSSTYATQTYVDTAVSNLVDSAPATLDTLNELASALGDDANFSTTVTTSIGTKWTEDATKISNWDTAYSWGDHSTAGYLTAETNDLSTTVTWANVPDANITESSVTQHLTATNVANAGALMDSEVTNLAQVKAFDSSDYATAAQGSTADSALQNVVEDTTPQLGGNLDLNSNDINGTGRIFITQASTTSPALTVSNDDSGSVESPTLRLQRLSSSAADGDQIGQIEFYGRYESGSPVGREYASIRGVINDASGTSADGQIDFYARKGSSETKLMSLTSTTLELTNGTDLDVAGNTTVGGNVVVTGTVDGRDVAADGAKIDAIGRFGYGDSQAKGVSGTTTHTMLTFSAPAPTSGTVVRSINGSVQIRFYLQSSQTPPRNLIYRTYLEMQSTGSTGTSLGTATYSSTPTSYQAWYYVTGNKTDVVSPIRGRIGTSSTGANYGTVVGCYYDASANRTYIRVSKYPDAATAYANVEIFYSPTNFYSAGTYVAPYLSNDNYMRLEAITYYDTRLQLFNEIFPRTSSGLYLRMRHRNLSGSTGVSILAYNNQGYIEATP